MNSSTWWPAPAKLNLCLHVNGKRSDGYHELQTLFQFVDWCDYLQFTVRNDNHITLNPELPGVPAHSNLIVKAARMLQQHSGVTLGADITLDKRLPMGGGIGGGSSDAATTLVALNQLWQTNIAVDELAQMGLSLGADVPVFVRGLAAMADGVGEQLRPVTVAEPWYLIIVPAVEVATADIFAAKDLPRDTAKITNLEKQPAQWKNDCQQVVCNRYPQVAKALAWLVDYAPSKMTGTGCCVFGQFALKSDAEAALAEMPTGWTATVTKGCNRSPLLALIA
ncbi:4-(cytidine 5'-diphospho)-2-C-methyl-D-erythritol kinase [Ferrimonas lipolytica]|uniref:4-diphosphocytidyl-2-C-methyl-D-erythritol kinase n=1 Tax=Ferrimonas lipolytica TaxID=2724191 RepID=A0A6H1UE33_9GAMM|nr:4-(cytidine 5'-diphospho)-2-C-methyl-D-erythritol kinase [Ferrimonas lipolytica]QIZ77088.1 4-(cytidine 5'-diphospho)-2-C-methyl-D-erythritol kinase [Ferrimonas lipolytica]